VFPFAQITKEKLHNSVFTTFKKIKNKKKNRERLIMAVGREKYINFVMATVFETTSQQRYLVFCNIIQV